MREISVILFATLLAVIPLFGQNGEFLIDTNVVFNPHANAQGYPAVAFDGTNYLVVWQDNRSDTGDIFAARVDPNGVLIDPSAFAVSIESYLQSLPAVTFDCGNYFTAWCDQSGYGNIYGTRITPEGSVLDTQGIRISQDWGNGEPVVTSDGIYYFVVWTQYVLYHGSVLASRVSQSGMVIDNPSILVQGAGINLSANTPACALVDTNYMIAFCFNAEHTHRIVGKRLTQSGIIIDTNWIEMPPSTFCYQWKPTITCDNQNCLIIWETLLGISDRDIYGARVTPSGIVLDSAGLSICAAADSQTNPCIAFNGTDYIVVWEDWRNGVESDIYGAKINTSGTVVDSFIVSNAPGNQISPAITHSSGSQVFITYSGWTDSINGQSVNAMRIWGKFYPELGITEHDEEPIDKSLLTVSPNPFIYTTEIRYSILDTRYLIQKPTLTIYDVSGRIVKSFNLESSIQNQESAVSWNGTDSSNRKLPSGVYFVKFVSDDHEETAKVLLVR